VSVGVAQWAAGERFDELVERADRALYDAKHGGRDRVEVHRSDIGRLSPPPLEPSAPALPVPPGHLH